MGFDEKYRILRSIVPDPQDPERDLVTDFKVHIRFEHFLTAQVFAPYLHVSEVLKELIHLDADGNTSPRFVSDDGVVRFPHKALLTIDSFTGRVIRRCEPVS
jgi:hypothetical protein